MDPCQVVPTDTLVSTLQLSCSAVQWREKRKSQLSVRSSKALNKGLTNDVSLSAVMLTLSPHGGHFLGGAVVQVSGPCLDESDNITCVFDGQETEGVHVWQHNGGSVSFSTPDDDWGVTIPFGCAQCWLNYQVSRNCRILLL